MSGVLDDFRFYAGCLRDSGSIAAADRMDYGIQVVADLIASQEKSREVLRNIVRDKKGGVHYAAAQAACHQANAALAALTTTPESN